MTEDKRNAIGVGKVDLGAVVAAEFAPGGESFRGRMMSYTEHPTVGIQMKDGSVHDWAAHLCRRLTDAEAAEYWRERACVAESRLQELGDGE